MNVSENQIVAELKRIFAATANGEVIDGIGDDCATLRASSLTQTDPRFVTSTDVLVEDVHFKFKWSTPGEIAKRAFAQNLADIAAAGARGTAMLVGLVVPRELPENWLFDFAKGFAESAIEQKVAVVGGDLARGKSIVVSVTAFGALDGRNPVLRSGARPGDSVAVSGELGFSSIGLELLERGRPLENMKAVRRYLAPTPNYAAGIAAAKAGASAMMDISDGLIVDASRLAGSSDVTLKLSPSKAQKAGVPDDNFYFGGEDHALLATFPPYIDPPPEFYQIGTVLVRGDAPVICDEIQNLNSAKRWDHFNV